MWPEDVLAVIGFYAVVAALVVTITYSTAVLPPQKFQPCTDLCAETVARMALGIRYAFGACLLESDQSQTAQSCQVLQAPSVNANHLEWGFVHRPFVIDYVQTMNLSATDHEPVPSFHGLFQSYIFFNSSAMLLSLFCIAIGTAFTASAFAKDAVLARTKKAGTSNAGAGDADPIRCKCPHLQDVRQWMQWPLLASLVSMLVSFVCILYYVFWRDDSGNNVGVVLSWTLAGSLAAIFVTKIFVSSFFSLE